MPTAASALTADSVPLSRGDSSGDFFPRDLAVAPDGKLRVLLEKWGSQAEQREAIVGPTSLVGEPLQLLAPLASQGDFTLGALSNTGAIIAFRSNRRPHPKLRATIWDGGKQIGPARTISDPAHSIRGGWTTTSANGAAEITFWQHLGNHLWEQRVAVRPAGASRFLPAVAASPTDKSLRVRNTGRVTSTTFWGASGDGAILWAGEGDGEGDGQRSVIRRILRDGTLGPAIPLPLGVDYPIDGFSAVTIGPDGTIVVAERSSKCGEEHFDGENDYCELTVQAHVFSIPAGSNTATAPVLLREAKGRNDVVDELYVGADVGPDGHVIVAVAGGQKRIEIFEGQDDLTALAPVASFPNKEWAGYSDFSVIHAADGGAAVFWGAETMTMMRGPGGAWSAPAYVLPHAGWGYSVLEHPRQLPDGGIAAIVRRSVDKNGDGDGAFVVRIHR